MNEEEEKNSENEKNWWKDPVREMALTGLAAVFMTEEAVRQKLKELRLPKELASLLLENISKKKDDFYGRLAKEVSQVFSKVDLGKEVSKFLSTHRVKIEMSFSPKGEKV